MSKGWGLVLGISVSRAELVVSWWQHVIQVLTFSSMIHSSVTKSRSKVTKRQKVLLTSEIHFFSPSSYDSTWAELMEPMPLLAVARESTLLLHWLSMAVNPTPDHTHCSRSVRKRRTLVCHHIFHLSWRHGKRQHTGLSYGPFLTINKAMPKCFHTTSAAYELIRSVHLER